LVAVDSECLDHLSAVISDGAGISKEILARHQEYLRESLFIISCSGYKASGGSDPNWNHVLHHEDQCQIPEFSHSRLIIAQAISQDGSRVRYAPLDNRDVERARNLNAHVLESRTLPAIRRYTGKLYAKLSCGVVCGLATGRITNLLIISALNGPTSPLDLIPNYDLTMKDSIDQELLKWRWPAIIQRAPLANLARFVQRHQRCIAPVGLEYKQTANGIAAQAGVPFLPVDLKNFGGSSRAGGLLNQVFSAELEAPDV
jgi:hypothetical protein